MNKFKKSWQLIALVSVMFFATACKKDDQKKTIDNEKKDILIGATNVNPDGASGSTFIQLIKDISTAKYDNKTAMPFSFNVQPIIYKNWIFDAPIYGEKGTLDKLERVNEKELQKINSLQLPSGVQASQIVFVNDNKAYLSVWNQGKIIIFNPTTMKQLSIIDISEYGIGDKDPNPSGMVLREDKLYVSLIQLVGGYFPDINRPYSDVLIIDTKTDKPEKMITEKTSGFAYPSRPADPKTMFMDEKGDIYIICLGQFGYKGEKNGILRIKNGETEFDPSYIFTITNTPIEGETHKANVVWSAQYAGNGKLYGIVNINAYYSNPPNFLKDHTCLVVEIDLAAKTIKKLPDLPRGNSYGSIGYYNEKIVIGISSDNAKGYHIYNPATGKGTVKPVITVEGEPNCFRQFGTKW